MKPLVKTGLLAALAFFALAALLFAIRFLPSYGGPYFQSEAFRHTALDRVEEELVPAVLAAPNEADVVSRLAASPDEIEEHRTRYGSLDDQLESLREQYSGNRDPAVRAARDAKAKDIRRNFSDDAYVAKKVIQEKKKEVASYFKRLAALQAEWKLEMGGFAYQFQTLETGERFSTGGLPASPAFERRYGERGEPVLTGSRVAEDLPGSARVAEVVGQDPLRFKGVLALADASQLGSDGARSYADYGQRRVSVYAALALGVLAALATAWMWRHRNRVWHAGIARRYDRLPIDIRLALFAFAVYAAFGAAIAYAEFASDLGASALYRPSDLLLNWPTAVAQAAFGVALTWLALAQFDWLRAGWAAADWKESWSARIAPSLQGFFYERSLGVQTLLLLGIVFFWGFGTMMVLTWNEMILVWIPATLFIGLPALALLLRHIARLNRLIAQTEQMVAGQLPGPIDSKGKSPIARHARNLEELRTRLRSSHSEQLKSERLKTELITNVSHDLRTPLTSIITYTDLLKDPDLTEGERRDYIAILDKKSMRLKTLIEDLFDVSKMATGNIEITRRHVDLAQLLQQALAEHQEAIEQSGLDYRVSIAEQPIFALVDGQKWWRALDNLLVNSLKYSLPGTRVYVQLERQGEEAVLTIKNIANYELGGDVGEWTERFKRADSSRNTEGSGLGLAIAQSIVDLHGGVLQLEVDGDLFKVTVKIAALA